VGARNTYATIGRIFEAPKWLLRGGWLNEQHTQHPRPLLSGNSPLNRRGACQGYSNTHVDGDIQAQNLRLDTSFQKIALSYKSLNYVPKFECYSFLVYMQLI
jgi:hypothetical protein